MDTMSCPRCQSAMSSRSAGGASVSQCTSCEGIFLERADLGSLAEAENDWHQRSGPRTAPLPRITADMTAPPASRPEVRAYIETLFA